VTERTFTLRELQLLAKDSVPARISLALIFSDTAEEILEQVDVAIDHIAQDFARTPKERQGRTEDGLTMDFVTSLRNMGFQASHDTTVGGHCDIVIEGRYNFLWLGEAKIHSTYEWLLEGFDQLDSRYATAARRQDRGGLIIYCFGARVDLVMDEWAKRLTEERPDVQIEDRCKDDLCFTSSHLHQRTGRNYRVRHVPISLYWNPGAGKKKHPKAAKAA
jgi:hypothetical protein